MEKEFAAKNAESTILKNNPTNSKSSTHSKSSGQKKNKFLPKTSCLKENESVEGKKSSSSASGVTSARKHTDKKFQDPSNVEEQPKLKKKKIPSQVARDHARRKVYWKTIKTAGKLRADNLAAHYAQLQETRTVSRPQVTVFSLLENSGCVEHSSSGSETHRYLTVERGRVAF